MIYPTRRAVLAAAAGAPLALAIAAVSPQRWVLGLAWPLLVLLLTLFDAVRSLGRSSITLDLPAEAGVGEEAEAAVDVTLSGAASPARVEVALDEPPIVAMADHGRLTVPMAGRRGSAPLAMTMVRRGRAAIDRLWVRWTGPLGLAWNQSSVALGQAFPILPDTRPVKNRGAELFARHAYLGLVSQLERGEGSDFDALTEFRPGMDKRSIDWKQSARHRKLLAKNYHSERNNQIVFVVDCGRQMSEPVAGMPRVDRAVAAMLLTAWVALKTGDRVSLHAFDSRPRLSSGTVAGSRAFGELKRIAANLDYSGEETNYVFALSRLAASLTRRSMIVLFTEFTDPISADFLVRSARRLLETHLLLVVVLRDEELEGLADAEPVEADDVTRAVTASALLKERQLTTNRLRHLGVHVIESEHDRVGERLVAGYVELKQRNLL